MQPGDFPTHAFAGDDGVRLVWRETGTGPVVMLLHGYFSNAYTNWIRYGHARAIAEQGFRVVMPDLRAHGDSAKPHDPAAYPPDILARDGLALVRALGLAEYDLGGYSLGARTVVRMLAAGARPRRVVLAGMGLDGLLHTGGRGAYFRHVLTHLGSFQRGSAEWMTEAFLKTTRGDPEALLRILDTFVDTTEGQLAAIDQPTLVLSGVDDRDNGSAEAIAHVLPRARYQEVPGNHMSAVAAPALGNAMADWLVQS